MKHLSLLIVIIFLASCRFSGKHTSLNKSFDKATHYKLLPDVEIVAGCDKIKGTDMELYKGFAVLIDGNVVYQDTAFSSFITSGQTFEAFAFDDNVYQVHIPDNHYMPSDMRLLSLTFKNDELKNKETLPLFFNKGSNLDNDPAVEYEGVFYDSADLPCITSNPCDSIWYWPVMVYEKTNKGFQVDTPLTKKENELIYGSFHGFKTDEKIILPVYAKFKEETERLRNIK